MLPLAVFTSPGPIVFQLGPLVLRWYGLLIAAAVLIGLALATRLGRERQIAAPFISDLLPVIVVSSVLGARLYYVLLEWRHYRQNWQEALAVWHGGYRHPRRPVGRVDRHNPVLPLASPTALAAPGCAGAGVGPGTGHWSLGEFL